MFREGEGNDIVVDGYEGSYMDRWERFIGAEGDAREHEDVKTRER